MGTSILTPNVSFTKTNTVQPVYGPPLDVLAYNGTSNYYLATELVLPASGTSVSLPIPSSWSTVDQVIVQNIESNVSNYAVLNRVSAAYTNTFTAKATLLGMTTTRLVNGANNQTVTLTNAGGTTYTWTGLTSPTGAAFTFTIDTITVSNTMFSLQSSINAQTTTTGITALLDTSQPNIQFNLISYPTTAVGGTLPQVTTCALYPFNFPVTQTVVQQNQTVQLAPNGGQVQESLGTATSTGNTNSNPKLWTLQSCDVNGVVANGQTTRLFVYMSGS